MAVGGGIARVALLGFGAVGRSLARQIADRGGISVIGVADSSAALTCVPGTALSAAQLCDLVAQKEAGRALAECAMPEGLSVRRGGAGDLVLSLPDAVDDHRRSGPIVVADCSNSGTSVSCLRLAVARGFRVAAANKKPFSDSSMQVFRELTASPASCRFESTAGAATPFVTTAMRLRAANDDVSAVLGSMSGTLGYLMSELETSATPSLGAALASAIEQGYTEPDCRDDLSGVDVQRKAVILARVLGHDISMDDVPVEALYTHSLATVCAALCAVQRGWCARRVLEVVRRARVWKRLALCPG